MDVGVSYLGRDFLKCCGHDQKWQGMSEVFERLSLQPEEAQSQRDRDAGDIRGVLQNIRNGLRADEMKVMHTTEFITQQGFDVQMAVDEDVAADISRPMRLGRQMNITRSRGPGSQGGG